MRMNRRNVLIGMGAIVAGGGAAIGTGAFSSVEATREVNIDTAGDENALIGIDVSGDLEGEVDNTISFDLENDLNLNAVTRFDGALTITNNRDASGDEVNIEIEVEGSDAVTDDAGGDGGLQFEVDTDGDQNGVSGDEGSVTFDVVFGLEGETNTEDGDSAIPDTITVVANDA